MERARSAATRSWPQPSRSKCDEDWPFVSMSARLPLSSLRLPLLCAPMSFASSLSLTLACCEAGIVGGWQGGNVRTIEEFESYLTTLEEGRRRNEGNGRPFGPHVVY